MPNGSIDADNGTGWEFSWSPVAGATQYQLYVQGRQATIPLVDVMTDHTQYRKTSLGLVSGRNLTGWRWKVRALVESRWTSWSEDRYFDVEASGSGSPK
jgi:hypothetical protein